jgi:hypothetical protein
VHGEENDIAHTHTQQINSTRDSSKLGAEINDDGMTRHTHRVSVSAICLTMLPYGRIYTGALRACILCIITRGFTTWWWARATTTVTLLKISPRAHRMPLSGRRAGVKWLCGSPADRAQPAWRRPTDGLWAAGRHLGFDSCTLIKIRFHPFVRPNYYAVASVKR